MKWVLMVMFMSKIVFAQQQVFLSRPIHGRPNIVVETIKNSTKYPVNYYVTLVYDRRSPNNVVLTRLSNTQPIAQLQHEVAVQWSYAYYAEADNEDCGCEEADEEFRVFYLEQQLEELLE